MNNIVLLRPELLWLLLLIAPVALLGLWRLAALPRGRRVLIVVFQSLSVLLVVGALAEPVRVKTDSGMSLVVALDASDSLSPQARAQEQQYAQALLAAAASNDSVQFVAFGSEAAVLTADQVRGGQWLSGAAQTTSATIAITTTTGVSRTQSLAIDTKHSDLAVGLRLANSLLGETGRRRVVLVSDGWETQGDAAAEAQAMAARGVDLQVVGLQALGSPEVVVKYLATTPYARIGDLIQSNLQIYSTGATSATLQIRVDGGLPAAQRVSLQAGENQIPLQQTASSAGYHSIDVQVVSASDTVTQNNSASSATVIKPQPRTLILEDRSGESYQLAQALEQGNMAVSVIPANDVPSTVGILSVYDSIILNNVAATSLTLDQQLTLQQFVSKQGKGMVVIGGSTAFAKGGYRDSALEEMLPVSSEPAPRPDQGQTALILVVDRSFSMTEDEDLEGNNKLSMARQASALAVDSLRVGDYLGVVSFDTANTWTAPFAAITSDATKQQAKNNILAISPGGGTSIYPALRDAVAAISQVNVPSKHIVLLTDGHERRDSNDVYSPLIAQINAAKISLTTIGVGSDVDKNFLTDLATRGQGRYYFTEQIQNIPRIVFRDLDLALKQSTVEGAVTPQLLNNSPVLQGFSPQDIPDLQGYDITVAKDDAMVGLISDKGDPLLANWSYGLGRVVAFTSDAGKTWATGWTSWNEYSRFWNQAARWSMASPVNHQLQPTVDVEEQEGQAVAHIAVESLAADNSFVDLADVTAAMRAPSGAITNTLLLQTAPGRYEATVPLSESGAYQVILNRTKDSAQTSETIGFSVSPSAELLNAGTNDHLLQSLISNKQYLTTPAQALDPSGLQGDSPDDEPLWPWLLAPALLMLLFSVAARRLDIRRKPRT